MDNNNDHAKMIAENIINDPVFFGDIMYNVVQLKHNETIAQFKRSIAAQGASVVEFMNGIK